MPPRPLFAGIAVLFTSLTVASVAFADRPDDRELERRFEDVVRPFLKDYCLACHGPNKKEAKLDLSGQASLTDVMKHERLWSLVSERLEADEMPPAKASRKPTTTERRALLAWIEQFRESEARKNAGDPGSVPPRRLSNSEYDYTIRDLTGADIRPTREFPIDPANEAGFDNSAESLTMSPALLAKYLAAARRVADHLVLKPTGFDFAEHPAVTDTDRDKYCVQRIIAFYDRHKVDYADYFEAAWRFAHRQALGKPNASLTELAREAGLSAKYLTTIHSLLTETDPSFGPVGDLQAWWRELPADLEKAESVRRECEQMRDRLVQWRREFRPKSQALSIRGVSPGSQPLVLWKNQYLATRHMSYPGGGVLVKAARDGREPKAPEAAAKPRVALDEHDPAIPRYEAAFARFCRVFPDAFVVADRGPYFDPKAAGKGRPLTAGFHLMQGYFRDDAPLYELVLDEPRRREIDDLWKELNFITLAPLRQYRDFIFFERAEPPRFMQEAGFDFARSEDKDSTSPAKIEQLRDAYLAKVHKNQASEEAIGAVATYFAAMAAEIRSIEDAQAAAEPSHLRALESFAARAYRRPLSHWERDELLSFYRKARTDDGLNHEAAIRDTLASVLLSPYFSYRIEPAEPGPNAHPVSDYALASRLSYFLWSSMPDDELTSHAEAGDLHRRDVLLEQTRRMLRDRRVRGMAVEFAGHWLDVRRFEEHNSVDRQRFPSFTNDLRQAMYEEPIRFFMDVAQRDRSVLDFLDAEDTFVNPVLAKHYGMTVSRLKPDEWIRVEDARRQGRGGLLPMSVFLTANSPGLRTSPVKRGYWVARRVLGQHIPPPPPEVPELPKDEAQTGELTMPQLLAKHREHPSCAGCHRRFDSIGLVFEAFGPIGERRDHDLGGRPVNTKATFPDGAEGEGLDGLRRYLSGPSRQEFLENLCRKLLGFALGRGLILSDQTTIRTMRGRLSADGYRFGGLVESIVESPQFLNKRGRDDPRERSSGDE
jgi:mono/diheme cytochrome c family protein